MFTLLAGAKGLQRYTIHTPPHKKIICYLKLKCMDVLC
jgi:hypothetical protein